MVFWENAVREAYNNPGRPLEGLISDKIFPGTSTTRNPQGTIDDTGQKAQAYRWGKELYGVLSNNIHAFEANDQDGYKIGRDHWGKGVRDILHRLRPTEYTDGKVNWNMERARYI